MHVIDELLLVHHVHLQHELLLDHLGHRRVVLAVPPDLCEADSGPPAEGQQEAFLESAGDVLRDVVVPRADDDRLAVVRAAPAICRSHLHCSSVLWGLILIWNYSVLATG